jgi:putative Ca2+/H+ antiporter (TMEM165/GDT1 family)
VVIGTIIGEVLINAPLVVLGGRLAQRLEARQVDLRWVHSLAGAALAAMGIAELFGVHLF